MGSKKGVRDKLETLVNELNIEPLLPKYPYEISGGQQQRVAIIRSLINDPYLLFADEPTGNLDSKSAYDVLNILKTLNETHKSTILMVTHDSVAASFCNRVIFLKDGKIVHEMQRSHEEKQFSFNQRILLYISKEVGENDVNIFTRT